VGFRRGYIGYGHRDEVRDLKWWETFVAGLLPYTSRLTDASKHFRAGDL
jgi:hypothetical protein